MGSCWRLFYAYRFVVLQVISGHLGWVRSIAFDPGNEWFCTGSADRTIKVSIASQSFIFWHVV
jgi:WD40 repeat protein